MIRSLLIAFSCILSFAAGAQSIVVKNIDELKKANKSAKPGDTIALAGYVWSDVSIELNCDGTEAQPIVFTALDKDGISITGHSNLKLGGDFIEINNWTFTSGYAGNDAVIEFRTDKKHIANNCRITDCIIDGFNNPKRMDENYWIALYGKHNRIDHCNFQGKNNMGVLMAVILDDDRSRENFHSVDHNYFGYRLPLASNSGEIIRIGVSQHCEFNSNTQIVDNFFDHCDGETEIVSVKSCSNVVRGNFFKECQGGVVLRHGNYNTVENNIFFGNGKEGTGGVRVINKGQWVVNNLFYKCRGVGFRSPLSVMNGVPNSPAFRYVPVTDAVIANNSFFDCTPISLCEGSDTERSVAPSKVFFGNNIFYSSKDKIIYNKYDDISGFSFVQNVTSPSVSQSLEEGFVKKPMTIMKYNTIGIPRSAAFSYTKTDEYDSLLAMSKTRLAGHLSFVAGLSDIKTIAKIEATAKNNAGAAAAHLLTRPTVNPYAPVKCNDAGELSTAIKSGVKMIVLTGNNYVMFEPLILVKETRISSVKQKISISSGNEIKLDRLFEIQAGNFLSLKDLDLDLTGLQTEVFISSDRNGSSSHSNFSMNNCKISGLSGTFFNSVKYTVFDSIIISNCSFANNKGRLFDFSNETDKKGYYTVEKLKIVNNKFSGNQGQLLTMLRGGNDESTMGPLLQFTDNKVTDCTSGTEPLISLYGTQVSFIDKNYFSASNAGGTLIRYEDAVRAAHSFKNNGLAYSGNVDKDKYVTTYKNVIVHN